jgi:hypothetical protein
MLLLELGESNSPCDPAAMPEEASAAVSESIEPAITSTTRSSQNAAAIASELK